MSRSSKTCLFLCEKSTVIAQPWAKNGWVCYCVDVQHEPGMSKQTNNIIKCGMTVQDFYKKYFKTIHEETPFKFAAAFPPCTDLANSGARYYESKGPEALRKAVATVKFCWKIVSKADAYMLENPIGRLPKHWKNYDYKFDPFEYGGYLSKGHGVNGTRDGYSKATCLWTGGKFIMPPKKPVPNVLGSFITFGARADRKNGQSLQDVRSKFPKGFSIALYKTLHRVL